MKAWWSNLPQVSQPVGRWWWCSVANLCPILCDPMDCSMTVLSITISWSLVKLMLLSQWCHPTVSSFVSPFSSCPQSFPALGSSNELVLHIRWAKVLEFQLQLQHQPSNSGLISFRMDWFDLLKVQEDLYSPSLTSIQDYWKTNSFGCITLLAKWCLFFLIHCLRRWWSWD